MKIFIFWLLSCVYSDFEDNKIKGTEIGHVYFKKGIRQTTFPKYIFYYEKQTGNYAFCFWPHEKLDWPEAIAIELDLTKSPPIYQVRHQKMQKSKTTERILQ